MYAMTDPPYQQARDNWTAQTRHRLLTRPYAVEADRQEDAAIFRALDNSSATGWEAVRPRPEEKPVKPPMTLEQMEKIARHIRQTAWERILSDDEPF